MNFQPRFANGIYRDCKWCGGKGCLSCEAEADKEYDRQFPNGPQPILTIPLEEPLNLDTEAGLAKLTDIVRAAHKKLSELSAGSPPAKT